jgi:hypothetical protein
MILATQGPFPTYPNFQPHYGPGADSASNKNEYQETSERLKRGRCESSNSPPSVSRLSKQYEIYDVSQSYRPPQPVTRIAFCLLKENAVPSFVPSWTTYVHALS